MGGDRDEDMAGFDRAGVFPRVLLGNAVVGDDETQAESEFTERTIRPTPQVLLSQFGTAREATELANAPAVHDIATPMQIPAPMITDSRPCAVASSTRPTT